MVLKSEFCRLIAKKGGYNICDVEKVYQDFLEVLYEELEKGEVVKLVGLGVFFTKEAKTETKNPKTGEVHVKEPEKIIKFKLSQKLKEYLR